VTSATDLRTQTFYNIENNPENGLQHSMVRYELGGPVSSLDCEMIMEAAAHIVPDMDVQFGQMVLPPADVAGPKHMLATMRRNLDLANGLCTLTLRVNVYRRVALNDVENVLRISLRAFATYMKTNNVPFQGDNAPASEND
jgi:hypothetical protein